MGDEAAGDPAPSGLPTVTQDGGWVGTWACWMAEWMMVAGGQVGFELLELIKLLMAGALGFLVTHGGAWGARGGETQGGGV